jgi:hypothetical protein
MLKTKLRVFPEFCFLGINPEFYKIKKIEICIKERHLKSTQQVVSKKHINIY